MSRRRLIFLLCLLALLSVLLVLGLPRLLYGPKVGVLKLAPHPVTQTVVSTGRVASAEESRLGATLSGRVLATPVAEGARVKAGAVLLLLESDELRASLEQAEGNLAEAGATLDEAQRQYARQQGLFAQGFVSRAALDAEDKKVRLARARVLATRAGVEGARARLAQLEIRAPANGRLIARDAEVGDLLSPGKPVLVFAAEGKTEIRLDVDERYLARLAVGQRARVVADAWPDAPFEATVSRIAPQVDLERGTLEVILRPALLPPFPTHNMTVSAEIVVAKKPAALTVPAAVLQERAGRRQVLRVRAGKVEAAEVVTGMVADGQAEILQGLSAGDLIVLPGPVLEAGQKVRAGDGA